MSYGTRWPRQYRAIFWYKHPSSQHWWFHEIAGDQLLSVINEVIKREKIFKTGLKAKFKHVIYDMTNPVHAAQYERLRAHQNPVVDDLGVW